MSAWIIYDKNGLAKCEARRLEYSGEFLGACSVSVNITSPTPIGFELGDWLEYRGERFELNYDPSVVKESSSDTYGEGFQYENIVFNSLADELTRCDFLDYVPKDNELHYSSLPTFSFFADSIAKLAERIQANLDRIYTGDKKWTVEVHPEYVNTLNVNITASNNTVWDALGFVNSKFGANFIIRGRKITIGTTGLAVGQLFSYGKGNGLYKIERNAESNQKVITRLRAYGSTRNMPTDYYHNVSGGNVPNNMAVRNLMLPSFPVQTHNPYIDSKNIAELGIREGTVFFDGSSELEEIYPTMEGMTAEDLKKAGVSVNAEGRLDEVAGAEQITDDGKFAPEEGEEQVTVPDFTISLKDVGFDLNDYLGTSSATISMKDGMCGGRDFEIVKCEKEGDGYKLTCHRHYDESLDLYFPYNSYQIKGGDKFVLLNIEMPDVYIKTASQRLLNAATAYLAKNDYVRYSYTLSVDNIFMARQHDEASANNETSIHDVIKEGDLMLFEDEDLGINGSITISSLSIKENADESIIPEYEITLQDEKTVGTIEKIQNQIANLAVNGVGGGSTVTTEQIKSIVEAIGKTMFLSKTKDDRTPYKLNVGDKLTAEKGIQIGESFIPGILTGSGGFIDEKANAELESLIIRRFLEVPELRYNRVQVTLGDKWNAPGAGVFERVVPDIDKNGNRLMSGTGYLKLEDGEYGAIAVGDICMGIFHSMNADDNAKEDSDDSFGNFQFAGFYTCYFTITEIMGKDNKQFRYQMRPVSDRWKLTIHPSEAMTFVCYGSFAREDRQTSVYTTRTYTRLLKNQNTWEINASNIAMQYGDMTNMNVHGLDMTGYSMYLNNIYMTGTLKQVKPDGTPVNVANDRGNWVSGTVYDYYDRVSHNGSLWLCINENGTNTEPKEGDSSWLCQVKSGSSIQAAGRWESKKTPYPVNSIVTFAEKVWISNKETSEPPFGTYTDIEENRLVYADGGYVLVETLIQSQDWDLLLDAPQLTDGRDGESLQVRYSSDKVNWHSVFESTDVWMQQRVGDDSTWSAPIRIAGEKGAAGADGTYYDYQFAVNDSLTDAPTSGWQDTPPVVDKGQYLWMRTRFVNPNSQEENPWSVARIGGEKGEQGDSITNMGAWKSGMAVPYLGMVTMGGKTFMSKVATNNPPMWIYTDNASNRFIYKDGGYVLTGEMNIEEYDLVMQNGKDGRDGKGYEYIYIHTKDDNRPSTPTSEQTDDYIPSGWHDDPIGVTATMPYEWVSMRTKKDDVWSDFSTPGIWAKYSIDAILADLDNEMDNIAITSDGVSTSETTIAITASMYYGSAKQALTSIQVGSVSGISSSYVLNTGIITLKVSKGVNFSDRTEVPITISASINGKEETRTLKFTLAAIRGGADGASAVLYDIITSVSSIGKRKDGSYTVNGVSATRMKTVGDKSSETTDGTLKYSIDGGEEVAVGNNSIIASDKIGSKIQFIFYNSDGVVVDKESVPMVVDGSDGLDGKDGEGFTMMGNWKTGMTVPKMGVVTMGGECFAAKVATTNPPLWCWTDKDGNRLVFSATEYILTGEKNTTEYEQWTVKGTDGHDGKDGKDGKDGQQGIQGCIIRKSEFKAGVQYRNDEALTEGTRYVDVVLIRSEAMATGWIAYKCKKTTSINGIAKPEPPTNYPTDSGWSPNNNWMSSPNNYTLWIARAKKVDGAWSAWEVSEYKAGYTDITQKEDNAVAFYSARYSDPLYADNTDYWEVFGINTTSIFTDLIVAKDASIDFVQGNELLIKGSDGVTVEAGLSGSSATGGDVRLWVGGETPGNAPFTVDKYGNLVATSAKIEGEITATSGEFTGVITAGSNYKMTINPSDKGYPSLKWIVGETFYSWLGMNTRSGYISGELDLLDSNGRQILITPTFIEQRAGNFAIELNTSIDTEARIAISKDGAYSNLLNIGIDSKGLSRIGSLRWPTSQSSVNVGEIYLDGSTLKVRTS